MILVTSDSHCYYETINEQIRHAESTIGRSIEFVIHLGDFGIFGSHLHDYFIKKKKRFLRPLFFIDGNHEDFTSFPRLVKKYGSFFTFLPRATVHTIAGYRFLALGGAAYMDSMITEFHAVITDQQIDQCLRIPASDVDILLTHDCPEGIGITNTPGMECYGLPGFPRSGDLAAHFKPRIWFFGHHHKWHTLKKADITYQGLCDTWKGYVLLDKDFQYTVVKHELTWDKSPLLERILVKLRIIRPDKPLS